MGTTTALEFLQKSKDIDVPPFCVVYGDEAFLKSESLRRLRELVLSDDDGEFSFTRFDGTVVSFIDVLRETSTAPMFGSGKRLVLVDPADAFLTQNRDQLEKYLDEPCKSGILVLQLASFPSNLRLYKKAAAQGLVIDCRALSSKGAAAWLEKRANKACKIKITYDAAEELVDLIGADLGALDQELRKLALLVSPSQTVDVGFIQEHVGSWRQKKVWDLVDAALDGNTAEALRQLDKLVTAGEAPVAILAQIASSLRKMSAVTQLFSEVDPQSPPLSISSALDAVGVKPFLKAKMTEQLKRLGSRRGRRLSELLLRADFDLKGGSKSDPRQILERFIVQISSPELRNFERLR